MSSDARELQRICQVMAQAGARPGLDERELVTRFFEEGFFSVLGYGRVGEDVRLEQRTLRGRIDVTLRAFGARPLCVLEFKRPGTPLSAWVGQLEEYAEDVLPEWGILTNGADIWLFRCEAGHLLQPPVEVMRMESITAAQARSLCDRLHRREVDLRDLDSVFQVLEEICQHPLHASGPHEPGGQQFIARFRLGRQTAFGRLVSELAYLLVVLSDRSDFTRGAYEFWRRVYARELDLEETPPSWRDLIVGAGRNDLYRFMFALETAYVLLARVLLAKAMQDAGFPGMNSIQAYRNGLSLGQHRGTLPPQAYLEATSNLFQYAGGQAFASLFGSDIFDWWQDAVSFSDVTDVANALAEATIAVFSFDFSDLRGDILGALYQSYFDPETRKALGEFYTPPDVVDFILDALDYQGYRITTARLLDPACGSGTFLVHAVNRYLQASEGRNPAVVLKGLIDGLRIVGFDINPFATLMAQVNYAAHLLPTYAEALCVDPDFELPRIPVFRTDSLRQEAREGEQEGVTAQGPQMTFRLEAGGNIAHIRTELPILGRENEFVPVLVAVPRFDRALEQGLVRNVEQYFAVLQAVFSVSREGPFNRERLEYILETAVGRRASEVAQFVIDAAQENATTIESLRREYGDGRFLKTLEDLSLALVLKNDLRYDYIVGNPPYVRIQTIPEVFRRRWQQMYTWAEGNFDIYIPFIQQAVTSWLRKGGYLSFICSDRFLLANYGAPLRECLPREAQVQLLLDLRDTEVFQQALNYPAIFVVRRSSTKRPNVFLAGRAFSDPKEGGIGTLLAEARVHLQEAKQSEEYRSGNYVDFFPQSTKTLDRDAWILAPPTEQRVLQSLEDAATHRLEELSATEGAVFEGLSTGADSLMAFQLIQERPETLLLRPRGGGTQGIPLEVEIEKGIVRRWFYGRDIERWHISWKSWFILWPYVETEGVWELMPNTPAIENFPYARIIDPLDRAFPLAWTYLTYNPVRHILTGRERGRFSPRGREEARWYAFSAPRSLNLYGDVKICLPELTKEPDAAVDRSGAAFGPGVCGITLEDPSLSYFLVALLNSSLLFFWLKQHSVVHGDHNLKFDDRFCRKLPIRLPRDRREKDMAQRIARHAEDLADIKENLHRLEAERNLFPSPQSRHLTPGTELYPMKNLAVGVLRTQNVSTEDFSSSPEMDNRWRITLGRNTLILPSEAHARLVERWLNLQHGHQAASASLMNLLIPTSAEGCHQLLDMLETNQSEITLLQANLCENEAETNELIEDLYGIDQEGRQVIRQFLDRF